MREMWIEMPDTMVAYLNRSLRTELADYVEMKVEAETRNLLKETTLLDTLTADYLRVRLNAAAQLELKLLEKRDGERIVCMVRTYYGPAAESSVAFYDMKWERLPDEFMRPVSPESMMQRPDTMTLERFREIESILEPRMVAMSLSPFNQSLVISLSVPLVSRDEEVQVRSVLVQRKLNWDGETFN